MNYHHSKCTNVHIYPSDFAHESRIEKIAISIDKLDLFSDLLLIGTSGENSKSQWFISKNIKIKLLGPKNTPASIFSKVIKFVKFYFLIYKYLRCYKISCINAHSLSVLPLCYILSVIHKCKLIYDTHELETETNSISGIRKVISKLLERILITRVDHVFVVSENIADWYDKHYPINRPTVLYNAPSCASVISRKHYFHDKYNLENDVKIMLYVGGLSSNRGIEQMLTLATELVAYKSLKFVFMGSGPLECKIEQCALTQDNIYLHSPVSRAQVIDLVGHADIGWSLVQDSCLSHYYSMPNKLFEYVFSGIPVLTTNMKETAQFVIENNVGRVISEFDVNEMLRSIDTLINDPTYLSYKIAERVEGFSWVEQETKLNNVYMKLFN